MKITRISLTNFRSFRDTQSIEMAPVTLLFGPNSVGKSTVLMALAYVQQILSKGHCNPQKLDSLGDKVVGGFRSLVYKQDLSRSIKIRVDFSPDKVPFVSYASNAEELANHIQSATYVLMKDLGGHTKSCAIELEIAWSERLQTAYVKNYRTWINGTYLGSVNSNEDKNNTTIRELNTQHPLLIPEGNEYWLETEYGEEDEREPLDEREYHTEFEQVLNQLNPNPANTAATANCDASGCTFVNRAAPISIYCRHGALPILGNPIQSNLNGQDFDEIEDHFNFLVIRQTLSQAFVLPLDTLLHHLERSIQIGPLRVVPDSNFIPNPHPEQKDWGTGKAAWDFISQDPNHSTSIKKLIANTSEWFSSADKLDSGYEIVNQSTAEFLGVSGTSGEFGFLTNRHIFFKELRTKILLSANQLGTGISQVLPIVVGANFDRIGMLSVEQPELHLHPRFQVELADIFLRKRLEHSFLIETHSEHIVLRLLRRIRKPEEFDSTLLPEDISIIYLTPTADGTIAQRLAITPDGDFEADWPHGFFNERDEELF